MDQTSRCLGAKMFFDFTAGHINRPSINSTETGKWEVKRKIFQVQAMQITFFQVSLTGKPATHFVLVVGFFDTKDISLIESFVQKSIRTSVLVVKVYPL